MSKADRHNVFFVGVARIAFGKAIIMTSHSYKTKTEMESVRQVLEQPNMRMNVGKHYSFSTVEAEWHLIAG